MSLQGRSIRTCPTSTRKTQKYKSNAYNKNFRWPINDAIVEIFLSEPFFATYPELLPDQGEP